MADQKKNIAYYLKYRPQTLAELIGQDGVKKTLSLAFQQNRLAHAYLLVGPRGTGKTSTARILAKMVNCEMVYGESFMVNRQDKKNNDKQYTINDIPCNKCATCVSITDGSNLDLIEIDAASNRGIEDIRSLREKIKLAPTSAKKKVYIIDEVHMLTTEAFNALLKTLEEPPQHALFILATTEVQKVPQTILSRVQRLDFKLASPSELLEVLKRIVQMEKIDIDEDGLKLLIKKSDGSFRDGVKLLDQVSSWEGKLDAATVLENLKSSQFESLVELIESFVNKDTSKALFTISKQLEQGVDIKELMLSLMEDIRSLVFIKNDLGEQLVKANFTEDKYDQLKKLSDSFSNQQLIRILDILQSGVEKLKFASIPQLPLELAVVEICGIEETDKKLEVRSEKMDEEVRGEIQKHQEHQDISPQNPTSHLPHPTSNASDDITKLKEKWTFVLETVRPFNFSLEALLRSVNITECTETTIIMEVPYSFHQRILEAPKNKDILEGVLSDILGRQIRVSTVLGVRPQRKEDIANIEVAADDEIIRVAAEIFNSDTIN